MLSAFDASVAVLILSRILHNQEREPRLPGLLKLLLWAQNQLDCKANYPRMNDLVSGSLSEPTSEAQNVY